MLLTRTTFGVSMMNHFVIRQYSSGVGYSVTLNIDPRTLKQLHQQGYHLYAFKGVSPISKATYSTVWYSTNEYMQTNNFNWTEKFMGYISENSDKEPKPPIPCQMEEGTVATVDSSGHLTVTDTNSIDPIARRAYNFYNPTNTETIFTCGLSIVNPDNVSTPICALPLNPSSTISAMPNEKVFFCFSTKEMKLGQTYRTTPADGLLLNLAFKSKLTVLFNMEKTWDALGSLGASKQKSGLSFSDLWGR